MEERSKQFDDIIRGKLEGLSPEMNPSDWIMMERLLEWEGLTDVSGDVNEMRFDEVAMDKLQNIPLDNMIPDWDRMSSMIEDANLEPGVEPSEFDQAIDNSLKDAPIVDVDMALWDKMQPALDADREQIIADLDNVAKEKLTLISELEPAWGSMQSKINRELFLPESVVKYRIIEVALITLFAISLFQLPIMDNVLSKENSPITQMEEASKIAAEDQSIQVNEDAQESLNANKIGEVGIVASSVSAVEIPNEIAIESVKNGLTASVLANDGIIDNTSNKEWTIDWNLPPSLNDLMFKFKDEDPFKISRLAFNEVFVPFIPDNRLKSYLSESITSDISSEVIDPLSVANEIIDDPTISPPTAVKVVEALQVAEMESINFARPKVKPDCASCDESKKVGLVLSMFTGSDYNEIVTPFDPVYAQEGTNQWNLGYGGGLSIGMKFRNWELETGAIYASNQYSPREVFDIYSGNISSGYIASTLKDIELEVVKIPLNFRFNVNLWDNWKIYALSGASLNMVIQSEYITDDVFLGTKTFATPSAPSIQNTNLSLKDFGEGILEGGKFRDNSFLTANLGFGIERTLNRRWSVFAQPTYQRQIFSNGIGPNQDRFNSISFFLGTRVTIK